MKTVASSSFVRRTLPLILLGCVLAVHAVITVHSIAFQRFWEDEAFNLTVPRNLLAGLGYTSDGILTDSGLTSFDVRITTGPSVLLPVAGILATGLDPVIASRTIGALFWCALLLGLWIIGTRIAGRWGGLAAVAVPLAFNTNDSPSPIQGPADLLGEIPAAALLVWASVLLVRRPWLAGLLAGLAVQAKVIAMLAFPALALGAIIAAGAAPKRWIAVLWKPMLAAAAPTALYWLWTLLALGPSMARLRLKEFRDFLLDGGQDYEPTTVASKIDHLVASWFASPILIWGVILVGALMIIRGMVPRQSVEPETVQTATERRELGALLAIATLGCAAFVVWWAGASHTPLWVRHPSPGIFAFVPILAAFAVRGLVLWVRSERGLAIRVSGAVAAGAFAALLVAQFSTHLSWTLTPREEMLVDQRIAADAFADEADAHDWIAADPWGGPVSIGVLTGAHTMLTNGLPPEVPRIREESCLDPAQTLSRSGSYWLCDLTRSG